MKVTKNLVRMFENEQCEHGTKAALENILWTVAYNLLHDIGVIGIKTKYRKK